MNAELKSSVEMTSPMVEGMLIEDFAAGPREGSPLQPGLLSNMSNELRAPLNTMLGYAQLMEADSMITTASQRESIGQILRAGWKLMEMINEILDLSMVESGQLSLSVEPVSLPEVMTECQALMEPEAQQRGVSLIFPQFDQPCFIKADRARLKQVLLNLLSNAIKYNHAGGTVVVSCLFDTPGHTRIQIKDTGAGLSPEKQSQLFQAFNRLGQEASGENGLGIGLVVGKRLLELMQGRIGVESEVGKGSVFWIELNSAAPPHLEIKKVQSKSTAVSHPHLLLYVEDNPETLKLMEQLIARHPEMRILTAKNGYEGIALAGSYFPEVILMDINLPGISGLDVMKLIRLDPATAHIPVIALSANAMPQDIEKGLEEGFFRYLTKPIKFDELIETLNIAFRLRLHPHQKPFRE